MRRDVGVRHLGERQASLGGIFSAGGSTLVNRVDALTYQPAGRSGCITGFGERQVADRA
jgi:hypothetical protein